jgi:hypothetical protein
MASKTISKLNGGVSKYLWRNQRNGGWLKCGVNGWRNA